MSISDRVGKVKLSILNMAISEEGSFLFIHGPSGSGKTQVVKELVKEKNDIPIIHFSAPLPFTTKGLFQRLLSTISGNANYAKYPISQLIDMTINWLRHIHKHNDLNQQPLIIMDDADIIINYDGKRETIEIIRQVSEATGAIFIFMSCSNMLKEMPDSIIRRSKSIDIDIA